MEMIGPTKDWRNKMTLGSQSVVYYMTSEMTSFLLYSLSQQFFQLESF